MSAFIINIRTIINKKKMKYYISRFLNSNDIKSRYVLVGLFFISDNDTEIKIGDTLYLDRMDKFDVKSFNFIILYSFLNQNINEKIVKIVFKFNELSKNNNIIRQHVYNKYDSVLSVDQIDTINFLNKIPFEINKDVLKIVVKEWDDKDNSILFNGLNRLHPKSDDFDKVKANIKREILSHNSKHWTYANIINIALLMKDHTIYFPTFLDFRGRIYPTPN